MAYISCTLQAQSCWLRIHFKSVSYLTFIQDESGSDAKRPRMIKEDHEAIVGWSGEIVLGLVYLDPPSGAEGNQFKISKLYPL